ncbi:DUF2500 family protein [Trichococcus sp.]|uniref:DUF2500 family protein n=1 Tax=Trichococcus sp. TaxID=1985464 RepID=UPI003C7AD95E
MESSRSFWCKKIIYWWLLCSVIYSSEISSNSSSTESEFLPDFENAKLIGKDSENASHMDGDSLMTTTTYVMTFEADDGERITFRVGRAVYRKYFIGDYGRLTYKRKWFRQFERI